jgi:methionine-rich copper-binding protein CopC
MKPSRREFLAGGRAGSLAGAAVVLVLWPPPRAAAHALVVASTPSANAAVAGPEIDVRVQFSDRIDKKRSKLSVASMSGQDFAVQLLEDESADMLVGRVIGLTVGFYRLRWQVLAVDGHITRGEIPFSVTSP